MELKTHYCQGVVSAWSNSKAHAELIATASLNNKTSLYDIDLFSVDLTQRSNQLHLVGSAQYNNPFHCLAWDNFGQKQGTHPNGLIFGGMQNGSFTIWDPYYMMGQGKNHLEDLDSQKSLIFAEEPEEDPFPITCAQWNSLKNNFLAFGSTSVLLVDVGKNVENPTIMEIGGKNPHEGSYVTSVAWNNEVNYIFASAGENGVIALWDIKKNDSIFQFKDGVASSGNARRNVTVAWSKSIATQIAVALDDEKKNQLQIWDLRNKKGPIIVIDKGHTKGINCLDWCETDPDLILTGGRDKQILCWDYNQDEDPITSRRVNSEIYDIKWSRKLPSIYSVVTEDRLSICSLDDKNLFSYVPKWHQVPAGATFNGNQTVICYAESERNSLQEFKIKPRVDEELDHEMKKLAQVLKKQDLSEFSNLKGEEGEMWKLLSLKTNQQNDMEIYDFLGLNKDKIMKEVEKYTGKKRQAISTENKKTKTKGTKPSKANYIRVSESQAANFFGTLSNNELAMSKNEEEEDNDANVKYDMVPRNPNWGIGKEKLIKESMLIGNYDGAIDAALKCGRTAEALIIAYSVDANLFNSTLKTFFTETTDPFISDILKHIAFKDNEELVKKYDLEKWRQCIALIFSISSLDRRSGLLRLLAARMKEEEKDVLEHAAIYCYILAEDFDSIVQTYAEKIAVEKSHTLRRKRLVVRLATKLISIFGFMTKNINISKTFQKILRELAFICLENGQKISAHQIFNEYIPFSSQRIIQHLAHNTDQLKGEAKHTGNVINLPIMQKKQERKQKKYEEVGSQPTSIKPTRNIKPIQLEEFQEEPKVKPPRKPQIKEKEKTKIPPPPVHKPNIQTEPVQPKQILNPTPQKPKKGPVPPPPKKVIHEEEQPIPERPKYQPPRQPATVEKSFPATHVDEPKVVPPPARNPKKVVPPPKREEMPVKKKSYDEDEEVPNTQVKKPNRVPQPPPPPKVEPQKVETYEDQEEEEQTYIKKPINVPPPKVNRKGPSIPPPRKQVTKQVVEQQQPKIETPKRTPPPPPPPSGGRRVMPPPRR